MSVLPALPVIGTMNCRTFDYLWQWAIDSRIVGALNTHVGLDADKVATTYLSNHDHSHVAWQAGARDNQGAMEWYRVQPYAIAQLTSPGLPFDSQRRRVRRGLLGYGG